MKRFFPLLITLALLFSCCLGAAAQETDATTPTNIPRDPGWCGEECTWSYNHGTLTISGAGAMDDFPEGAPWAQYREEITRVVISGSIHYIGAYAFADYDAITQVYLGDRLQELGKQAFYSCDGLTELALPATFRVFGEECLRNCTFLKEIHCQGGMPSFRLNCLWDTWVDIFYPVNNPWPLEHIQQLEDAFQGRIEFLAEDGYDPYIPPTEEATLPTTEPVTEPPTEATTQPTQAPTLPPTEETTQPATQPSTAPPETTEPPVIWGTEPVEAPREQSNLGSWIGGVLIGISLTCVALGALLFRRRKAGSRKGGKGKYSR